MILERTLPQSLDAERCVIGSVLLDPQSFDAVATTITASDFYHDDLGCIWRHLAAMRNGGESIEAGLLAARLRKADDFERVGGAANLVECGQAVANAAHVVSYAIEVRDLSKRRQLIQVGQEISHLGYECDDETDRAIAKAESSVLELSNVTDQGDTKSAAESLPALLEKFDRRLAGEESGLPSGLVALDSITGGWRPSELVILAARPSMGKSSLAGNIAEHVAIREGRNVLVFSLEMDRDQWLERMIASMASVDATKLREGTTTEAERERIANVAPLLATESLVIDDKPGRTMPEIMSIARRQKRAGGLDLLVIDYLQIIEPENQRDPRTMQVTRMSRQAKQLARELGVPLICLAQLNRQVEQAKDNRPKLSHLRESGAIEQEADIVLFVHRQGYFEQTSTQSTIGDEAELIVAKNRNGRTGTAEALWFNSITRFENQAAMHLDDTESSGIDIVSMPHLAFGD